jgi:hypothetical protein
MLTYAGALVLDILAAISARQGMMEKALRYVNEGFSMRRQMCLLHASDLLAAVRDQVSQ